jgi:thiol-disulfide isomerase/thioredoxin
MGWLLASLAWAAGSAAGADSQRPGEVPIGQPLRDGSLVGLNGPSHRLSDFRGRPLIINVWASWCGPCRQEMSSLERLAWRGDARSFSIIGISTDDDPAAAQRLLASTNATIDHFIDQRLFWETMLGASQLPLTVLVDARGKVRDRVYGARQWDGADAAKLIARDFDGAAR